QAAHGDPPGGEQLGTERRGPRAEWEGAHRCRRVLPMPADAGAPSGVDAQTPFPAFVVERRGDDVAAGMRELTLEALPPGEILVAVAWSCVNYKDGMVTV